MQTKHLVGPKVPTNMLCAGCTWDTIYKQCEKQPGVKEPPCVSYPSEPNCRAMGCECMLKLALPKSRAYANLLKVLALDKKVPVTLHGTVKL